MSELRDEAEEAIRRAREAARVAPNRDFLLELASLIERQARELAEARAAVGIGLDAFTAFMKEANWGASALSADTIRKANEAPGQMRRALASRNPADGEAL